MNDSNNIQSNILRIVQAYLEFHCMKFDKVDLNSRLEKDLGLDSLDRIDLLMDVEKEYKITIEEDVYEKIDTVSDVVDAVNKLHYQH